MNERQLEQRQQVNAMLKERTMINRRNILLLPFAVAVPIAPPSEELIESTAKEMFLLAHKAAREADSRPHVLENALAEWSEKWNDASAGYRSGWIALAKWHLSNK